jgi:para-nitrobenzyl esterase
MTGNTPQGKLLAHRLGSSFAALAKTGNPNNSTIPKWNAYNSLQRPVMIFGAQTYSVNDPAGELRRLWDEILPT